MSARNYGCRITDDLVLYGNRAVVLENRRLRMTVLTDRGTDVIEMNYKPLDIDLMWRSPVPLHKRSAYLSNTGDSLGNYLDHNSGGWQEILPNGGAECVYKNAVLGMHGEVSSTPWKAAVVCDEPDCVSVRFTTQTLRSPFRVEKTLTLRGEDAQLLIEETLTNLARETMQLMWGQHPTLGEPFLSGDCSIQTNAKRGFTLPQQAFDTQRLAPDTHFAWPVAEGRGGRSIDLSRVPARDSHTADMLYLTGFPPQAYYQVHNASRNLSLRMAWDGRQFPYLWMWLVCGGSLGYPWYGRTYNLALEPWTSYSANGLTGAIENGSCLVMEAGQTIKTAFEITLKEGNSHA